MATYYIDGEFVDSGQAALPLSDMAILRGYAVFDYLRTYNSKPFHLREHLMRLQKSAALLHLDCPWSLEFMEETVFELLRINTFAEATLRLLITGGDSIDSITPGSRPRLVIMAAEMTPFPSHWYTDGVKIITADVTRYIPGSKSTSYIPAIVALKKARQQGAVESIYVNEQNQMLEGTTSNLFAVAGEQILTPAIDILPGITRDVVMRLAGEEFSVECGEIRRDGIDRYTEFFLTSSNKEVVPVVRVDEDFHADQPGPVTRKVMELFRRYTQSW